MIWKRFNFIFYIMLIVSVLFNSFVIFTKGNYVVHTQDEFDHYISIIENQAQNIEGISIFQDYDTYDIKKINKTSSLYNNIKDTVITENDNSHFNMLSDQFIFGFIVIALVYELYIFVYDRDKGYDHLVKTLYNGKTKYFLLKLIYIIISIIFIYIINILFSLLYTIFIYDIDLFMSIQSISGYIHCWFKGNILSYYVMMCVYRLIWIIIILVIAPVIYVKTIDLYIALIKLISFILLFIIINMIKSISHLGLIFQLSSSYFKELYLMNIFNIPIHTVNIAIIICISISIFILLFTLKLNSDIYESKRISKINNKILKHKYHNNFYYEGKKIFIYNGFIIIMIISVLFQCIHYFVKEPVVNETNAYYTQYMNYLEGEYTLDKEQYLNQEINRYKEIENRIAELISIKSPSASMLNELKTLQYNLKGKYAFDLVLERAEYIKQTPNAMFYNDLSLYYMCYDIFDNILDFIVYLAVIIIFIFLLYYEEKRFNMDDFLKTLPSYKNTLKNKKLYILIVSFIFSVMSVFIKLIFYSTHYGNFEFYFPVNSVPYLSMFNINILSFIGIILVINFIVYSIISMILFRFLTKSP